MRRLGKMTFDEFVAQNEVAVVTFLSPCGEASMVQAIELAALWMRGAGARFGYVDSFEEIALSKFFEVRVLPTTLILSGGEECARLEGMHEALAVSNAVATAAHHAEAI